MGKRKAKAKVKPKRRAPPLDTTVSYSLITKFTNFTSLRAYFATTKKV